jgi:oligosaccharide repeat unit polymerase
MICLSVLFAYLYEVGLNNIALFKALGEGKGYSAAAARSAMGNAFEGKYHWYYLFINQLMQICAFGAFAQMLIYKKNINKTFFVIVFFVTSFSLIMMIEKAPIINFLIALFFVYVLSQRNGIIPIKALVPLGSLLVFLIVATYIFFMGSESPTKALFSAISRIFTGGIQPAYHYLEFFPKYHEYLLGRSLPNPGGLLPFDHYRLTAEIMNWHKPDLSENGIVGSMPAVYWAELYANFGLLGILIPPFFVGAILYWLNSLLMRLEFTPIYIAIYIWLAMHFKKLAISSLSGFFIDIYLISAFAVYLIITLGCRRGKIKIKKRLKTIPIHE